MVAYVSDMRSDLLVPRSSAVVDAVAGAFRDRPAMDSGEDPHEAHLLSQVCDLLGCEAGLFLPTCTMANQVAVRCWLPSGGPVAADALSHIFTVEHKALGLTGAAPQAIPSQAGHITPQAIADYLTENEQTPCLVWLENTHNLAGGSIMPAGWQVEIAGHCAEAARPLHLDGSRLWNAAAADGQELASLAEGVSSVALSLNKAVGAPMGAVLAGPRALIEQADQVRKAMSGEWRPIGPLAAGALAAIQGWRERLHHDHETAREIAAGLQSRLGDVAVSSPETNIIMLHCPMGSAGKIVAFADERGVKVLPISDRLIRFAIHGGVDRKAVPFIVEVVTKAWEHVL